MDFTTHEGIREALSVFRCGGAVKRYHTIPTITTDTVASHSYGVACFCYMLWEWGAGYEFDSVLLAALFHDIPEQYTGDIPAPVKRGTSVFQYVEAQFLKQVGLDEVLSNLSERGKRTLKIADMLDGLSFCVQELTMGNRAVIPVADNYISYLVDKSLQPHSQREAAVIEVVTNAFINLVQQKGAENV